MSSGPTLDKGRGAGDFNGRERRLSDDSDYQNNKRTHSVVNEMIQSVLNDDDDVASHKAEGTKGSMLTNSGAREDSRFAKLRPSIHSDSLGTDLAGLTKKEAKSGSNSLSHNNLFSIQKQRSLSQERDFRYLSPSLPQGYNREFDKKSETNSYLSFQDCIGENPFNKSQIETSSQKPTPIEGGPQHFDHSSTKALAATASNDGGMYLNADYSKDGIRSQNNFDLQPRPAGDDLRSQYSAPNHSEVQVTQNLNRIFHNQSFDIDSTHMMVNNDSNFGTGGQHNNSNYIMDAQEQIIYRRQMDANSNFGQFSSQQSQMVIGFANLPINPDLIQYNEKTYNSLIQNELQGSRNEGVKAGIVKPGASKDPEPQAPTVPKKTSKKKVHFEEDHEKWNSSRVKYQVNYPIDKFMADYQQKEESNRKENFKKSLSEQLQKKFSQVTRSLEQLEQIQEIEESNEHPFEAAEGNLQKGKEEMAGAERHSNIPFTTSGEADRSQSGRPGQEPLESQSAAASESKRTAQAHVEPPTNVYQTQPFQHQNVMLNRDPEFLYKQHQKQQQLIQQHHKKMKDRQQQESSEKQESAKRQPEASQASADNRSLKPNENQRDHLAASRGKVDSLATKPQKDHDRGMVAIVIKQEDKRSGGAEKAEQKEIQEEKPEAPKSQGKEQARDYYIFPSTDPFDLVRSALGYVTSESQAAATSPSKEQEVIAKKESPRDNAAEANQENAPTRQTEEKQAEQQPDVNINQEQKKDARESESEQLNINDQVAYQSDQSIKNMAIKLNDKTMNIQNFVHDTSEPAACDASQNNEADRSKKQTVVSLPQNGKASDITADQTQSTSNMENFKMLESQKCSTLENGNSGATDSNADYAPVNIEHSNDEQNHEDEQPSEKKQQPGIISSILNFFDMGPPPEKQLERAKSVKGFQRQSEHPQIKSGCEIDTNVEDAHLNRSLSNTFQNQAKQFKSTSPTKSTGHKDIVIPADLSADREDGSKKSPYQQLEIEDKEDPDFLAFEEDNNRSIFSGNFQNSLNNDNKSSSSNPLNANNEEDEDSDSESNDRGSPDRERQRDEDHNVEHTKRRPSKNAQSFKGNSQRGHFRDVFHPGHDTSLDQQASNVETSSSKVEPIQILAKTKKDFNRFSMNEIATKDQKAEPASETSNRDEAEAIKSNFSTEAQPNQQRVYNSSHLQKYDDLSNKINRFSRFSDTLKQIKNSKTKSVLAGRSQGRTGSSSNRSNSSKICSSLDPNDIDGLEQRVSNDLQQLEKMLSKHLNLEQRIGSHVMNMNQVDMARSSMHPQQAPQIQGYPVQNFGMLPQQVLQSHQIFPPQYQQQQQFQYYPGPIPNHFVHQQQQNHAQMLAQPHGFQVLPHYQAQPQLIQMGPQPAMQIPMQVPQINQGLGCYQPINMNQMQGQPVMMPPAGQTFVPQNQNEKYENQNHHFVPQEQHRPMPGQTFGMGTALQPQDYADLPAQRAPAGGPRPAGNQKQVIDNMHRLLQLEEQSQNGQIQLTPAQRQQLQTLSLDMTEDNEMACCRDQKCSRFIQKRLKNQSAPVAEKQRFLDRILKSSAASFETLVQDSFGNYVIQIVQQLYPNIVYIPGSHIQEEEPLGEQDLPREYIDIIFDRLKSNVVRYSTHKHGCRAIQTGLQVFTMNQKIEVLAEILTQERVRECSFDYHGNHVIQKCIIELGQIVEEPRNSSSVPGVVQEVAKPKKGAAEIRQLLQEIEAEIVSYCLNEYCCRIVQRMFEFCHIDLIESSARLILNNYQLLSNNEYGIFVLSSILEHGQPQHKTYILNLIQGNAAVMAIQKDGSKLIENSIRMILQANQKHNSHYAQLFQILDEIVYLPNRVSKQAHGQQHQLTIEYLLMNRYANYVIQAAYDVADEQRRQTLLDQIQYTLSTNHNAGRETPLKHVLKYLQKYDIYARGNQLQGSGCRTGAHGGHFAEQSQPDLALTGQGGMAHQRGTGHYKQQAFDPYPSNFHPNGAGAVIDSTAPLQGHPSHFNQQQANPAHMGFNQGYAPMNNKFHNQQSHQQHQYRGTGQNTSFYKQ